MLAGWGASPRRGTRSAKPTCRGITKAAGEGTAKPGSPQDSTEDRTAGEMVKTNQKMVDKLHKCGIHPKHQVSDDKISETYKVEIRKKTR